MARAAQAAPSPRATPRRGVKPPPPKGWSKKGPRAPGRAARTKRGREPERGHVRLRPRAAGVACCHAVGVTATAGAPRGAASSWGRGRGTGDAHFSKSGIRFIRPCTKMPPPDTHLEEGRALKAAWCRAGHGQAPVLRFQVERGEKKRGGDLWCVGGAQAVSLASRGIDGAQERPHTGSRGRGDAGGRQRGSGRAGPPRGPRAEDGAPVVLGEGGAGPPRERRRRPPAAAMVKGSGGGAQPGAGWSPPKPSTRHPRGARCGREGADTKT